MSCSFHQPHSTCGLIWKTIIWRICMVQCWTPGDTCLWKLTCIRRVGYFLWKRRCFCYLDYQLDVKTNIYIGRKIYFTGKILASCKIQTTERYFHHQHLFSSHVNIYGKSQRLFHQYLGMFTELKMLLHTSPFSVVQLFYSKYTYYVRHAYIK